MSENVYHQTENLAYNDPELQESLKLPGEGGPNGPLPLNLLTIIAMPTLMSHYIVNSKSRL